MDENTRFLMEHIDKVEQRTAARIEVVSKKLDELHDLKNRVYGVAVGISLVSGGVGSLIAKAIIQAQGG
jgi:hypothetical protein